MANEISASCQSIQTSAIATITMVIRFWVKKMRP